MLESGPNVRRWIRPELLDQHPYHVPPAQGLIKLDAMENPYSWPPELVQGWLEHISDAPLNRYPDPQGTALVQKLRHAMDIPESAAVMLGNGSDELIQLVMMAVAQPGRVVMSPDPGFVMYRLVAGYCGMDYVSVPLNADDFSLDLPAMLAAIEQHQPAVVFLAYPNNPTGNLFDAEAARQIIRAAPGVVVVDEAYFSFADSSFISELGTYPNLLVMRTVSKLGLAGLRLGLLAGPQEWLEQIDKLRLPYNINVLTQLTAAYALDHYDVLAEQTLKIRAERAVMDQALRGLPGLHVFASEANFVLIRVPAGRADKLATDLRGAGILIKNLNPTGGLLKDCLRLTVGTPEENRALLQALENLLENIPA